MQTDSSPTPSRAMRRRHAPQVFLCHSSKDKAFVRRIARELSALSVHVWLDEWEMKVGDSLHDAIGAALNASAFVAVVLSPSSARSRWVNRELQVALAREMSGRRGRKVVLPLVRRRTALPPFLTDRLYLDFSRRHYSALAQLAAFLFQLDQQAVAESLADAPPKSMTQVERILKGAGWTAHTDIDAREYDQVRRILRKFGVDVRGAEFEVVVRPRRGHARKRYALRR